MKAEEFRDKRKGQVWMMTPKVLHAPGKQASLRNAKPSILFKKKERGIIKIIFSKIFNIAKLKCRKMSNHSDDMVNK